MTPNRLMSIGLVASLWAGSVAAGVGCSGHDDPDPDITIPDPELPSADADLAVRIDAAVRLIRADTCFAKSDPARCEWADYEIGPAQFRMAASTGEAILVIDALGPEMYPELVRYRNRILGFYRIIDDAVTSQVLAVHLPRRLGDVLTYLAGPAFIPASALTPISQAADQTYAKIQPLSSLGHGGIVFGHLVELVPQQPLVLVDMTHLLEIPSELCQAPGGETLDTARAHVAAVAASLRQVIAAHNVRFINASFGSSVSTLAAAWTARCGGAAPSREQLQRLLRVFDPIYDLLFHAEGVITAQAAAELGDPADFPFDQVSERYANRVRIGFISSLSSGLDELGRGAVPKAEQFPSGGGADVYVNWGCDGLGTCGDPHYQIALLGLTLSELSLMTTSYVAPLGLARLVNLRYARHASEPMTDALIQTLAHELTPPACGASGTEPCVYQDPLAHHQLEPYRLRE